MQPTLPMGKLPTSQILIERRRAGRLTASRPVLVWRPSGSLRTCTTNVSTGGLLLPTSPFLTPGKRLKFAMQLREGEAPVAFFADIREVDEAGAHVVFAPDGVTTEQMRQWIEASVLPEIEGRIGGSEDDTRDVIEAATWHRQAGRLDTALGLFRAASETRPRGLTFQEERARCLVAALGHPGSDRSELARELLDTAEQGLTLGASQLLARIRATMLRAEPTVPNAVPPAATESEAGRLRESIRVERARLYAAFSHLLIETNRLQAMESVAVLPERRDTSPLGKRRRSRLGVPRHVPSMMGSLALIALLSFAPGARVAEPTESPALLEVRTAVLAHRNIRATPRGTRGAGDVHCERGLAHLRDNEAALAIEQLRACVAVSRRSADAYLALGLANALLGDEKQALVAFEQFMALAPRHRDIAVVRALVAELRGHQSAT